MDLVGALYSTIPSTIGAGGEGEVEGGGAVDLDENEEESAQSTLMATTSSHHHHHHQNNEEEFFFFSDGHSEVSDSEAVIIQHTGHEEEEEEVMVDESNLDVGQETMVLMQDDVIHGQEVVEDGIILDEDNSHHQTVVHHEHHQIVDGLAIDTSLGQHHHHDNQTIDGDPGDRYKPVLDEKEREKLYRLAIREDEDGMSPRGGKFYSCDQCDESFGRKVMLEKHIEKYHKDDPRPFTCTICLKKFKKRSKLQKHSWTHIGQLVDQSAAKASSKKTGRKNKQVDESFARDDSDEDISPSKQQQQKQNRAGFVKKGKHSKFKCDMCKKGFSNPTKLLLHKRTSHKNNQCEICMEIFANKKELDKHRKQVHAGEKPFKCSVCTKKFAYEHQRIRHEMIHTDEAPFRCEQCDRGFLSKVNLNKHLDSHEEFQCKICGKVTYTRNDKRLHMKQHAIGDEYNCRACGESFTRISELTKHCKSRHKEMMKLTNARKSRPLNNSGPSECRLCGKVFESVALARKHFALVHREPIFCRYCPKSFSSRKRVEEHERIHTGERPFECKECNDTFTTVHLLRQHSKATHSKGGKSGTVKQRNNSSYSLTCSVCTQKFDKSDYLARHRRTHYDEKPYQCEICGQRFHQLSLLKSHLDMHANNKMYECQICTRKFTKAQARNDHTAVHAGIPLRCLACGMEFGEQSQLIKHERRLHCGEKVFRCLVCDELFDHRWSLFRHELLHYGEFPLLSQVRGVDIEEDNIVELDYETECFIARRREQELISFRIHQPLHPHTPPPQSTTATNNYIS